MIPSSLIGQTLSSALVQFLGSTSDARRTEDWKWVDKGVKTGCTTQCVAYSVLFHFENKILKFTFRDLFKTALEKAAKKIDAEAGIPVSNVLKPLGVELLKLVDDARRGVFFDYLVGYAQVGYFICADGQYGYYPLGAESHYRHWRRVGETDRTGGFDGEPKISMGDVASAPIFEPKRGE